MTKKLFCVVILICVFFTGCETQWGSKYVTDVEQYGEWESYLEVPSYLPESVDGYRVNGYSYTLLAYMDICYEIFLDITVTEEQFEELIAAAKSYSYSSYEKEAYYSDGYKEIVFEDFYDIHHRDDTTVNVGWADIEKIIYNPETLNIIYVCFHANDTGVYHLNDVAYFNRFSIQENKYVENIN